jgi:hypothetical protein
VLTVAQVVEHAFDDTEHGLEIRVQVLVDRGADDDDDVLAFGDRPRIRRRGQSPGREHAREQLLAARLTERHPSRPDSFYGLFSAVIEGDSESRVGHHQSERKPDVAASSHDHNIPRERLSRSVHCILSRHVV